MDMREMTLAVASHYQDALGRLGYAMFEAVNTELFAETLPWPMVHWGITAHGHCLGLTFNNASHPPTILLHPSLVHGVKADPWGIPSSCLGVLFALDTMIHECMHVAVGYCRGPWQGGESSHNNPLWIAEVNRLAPLLGWPDVIAAMSKVTREGKTLVRRAKDATIPFGEVSRFPYGVRLFRGEAEAYYTAKRLPFPVTLPDPWQTAYHQPVLLSTISNNGQAYDEALPDAISNIESSAPPTPETHKATLDYDPHKCKLGSPCAKAGHQSHGVAGNLRRLIGGDCIACREADAAAKKATRTRRQATGGV